MRNESRSPQRRLTLLVLTILFLLVIPALAVHDAGVLELDADIDDGASTGTDWGGLFNSSGTPLALPSDGLASTFAHDGFAAAGPALHDGNTADQTTFATGSKDTLEINTGWQCNSDNNPGDDVDINHAYAAVFAPTTGNKAGKKLLYMALERYDNTGTGFVGFWVIQNQLSCTAPNPGSAAFSGTHTDGDILIVSEFTGGGTINSIDVYKWCTAADPNYPLSSCPVGGGILDKDGSTSVTDPIFTGVDCDSASANDTVCGNVNTANITSPWANRFKDDGSVCSSPPCTVYTSNFIEVGIDITTAFPNSTGCFSTFLGETRSSAAISADLKDYAMADLQSCPDLTATKSNDVSGSVVLGNNFTWKITVANSGTSATFADGQTILTDNLPSGPTYGSATPGNFTSITNSGNISCSISSNTLTCAANGGSVTIGDGGSFDVSFSVTPNSTTTLVNPSGGVCQVDPNSNITESNENNNTCSDTVTVTNQSDLTATKTNSVSGTAVQGIPFTWTITVSNGGLSGATFTSGQTILTDNLPSGPTYGSASPSNFTSITNSGNISCSISSNTLTCTANGGSVTIGAGGSFDVSFSVTPNSTTTLVNPSGGVCQVDPNSNITESNENNNTCSDTVTVTAPDLTATKTNSVSGTAVQGTAFTWTITVSNGGNASATFTSGQTILTDNLPSGPTYGSASPSNFTSITNSGNISCSISSNTLTCTANGGSVTIGAGGSFDVSFSVTPNSTTTLVNPSGGVCQVDPNSNISESNENNNTCSDTVTVTAPDLTATKTNSVSGTAVQGTAFTWTITVSNGGNASATFTSGQTILTDNLPSGPTYGSASPSNFTSITNSGNISCSISSNTLMCTANGGSVTIGAGGSFDVSFSVTPNSTTTLVNPSGGVCQVDPNSNITESNENNNTCSDTVTVTAPDLTATKTNSVSGTAVQGTAFTWTITVSNGGNASATFTSGQTILTDNLPSGPTYGSATAGNFTSITNSGNISCSISSNTLTCTANGGSVTIGAGGSFDVSFSVTPNSTTTLVNPSGGVCQVDPNSNITESNENNNTCSDTVLVTKVADLELEKTHTGQFYIGQQGTYTLKVTNHGPSSADGPITVTDTLPAGLSFVSGTGTDWTCSAVAQIVTCINPNSMAVNAMTTITLTVNVLPGIAPSVTNTACVSSPTPDPNLSNNCDDDTTEICMAEVRGVKYTDYDGDGNKDGNDRYLPGITITVTGMDGNNNPVSQTTVTDNNGAFIFKLPTGTYLICEIIPPGMTQTYPKSGPICASGGYGHLITLTVCEVVVTLNDGGTRIKFANMPVIEFGQEKFAVNAIHALATKDSVRFTVTGEGIKDMDVHIYDLKGRSVYHSEWQKNGWAWALQSDTGERVSHGVYLYTIRVRGTKGETAKLQIKKLVTLPLTEKNAHASSPEKLAITDVHALNGKNAIYFLLGSRQAFKEMKIEVFDLTGQRVYSSEWQATAMWAWSLNHQKNERIVSGVYLYVASIRNARGESVTTQLQKLIVK